MKLVKENKISAFVVATKNAIEKEQPSDWTPSVLRQTLCDINTFSRTYSRT